MKKIITILMWIYAFICCAIFFVGYFYVCSLIMYRNFSVPQFVFHVVSFSTETLSRRVIGTILVPFCLSVGFILLVIKKPLLWLRYYVKEKYIQYWLKRKNLLSFMTSSITAIVGVSIAVGASDVPASQMLEEAAFAYRLIYDPLPYDTIIDENYVDPKQLEFKQTEQRNLIVIFAESLERTFTDATLFGEDLLPRLLQQGGVSVVGYEKLSEVDWTHAGIMASLCGLTSKQYFPPKNLSSDVMCVSDILRQHGYNTYYLQGSTLKFVDFKAFLAAHGFTTYEGIDEIADYSSYQLASNKLYSDKLYEVNFIGDILDDADLLKLFQAKIEELAKQNKPFLAMTATMNTHPFHGFASSHCAIKYKDMRDALLCTDEELSSFVSWFKQQDFAANTTLIIMGDHLMMYNDLQKYLDEAPRRETLNLIWGVAAPQSDIHKAFNQFDWAPTLLQMAGFKWNSQRFGLGVSLFSSEKTMQERYGDDLNRRLLNNSRLYETEMFK